MEDFMNDYSNIIKQYKSDLDSSRKISTSLKAGLDYLHALNNFTFIHTDNSSNDYTEERKEILSKIATYINNTTVKNSKAFALAIQLEQHSLNNHTFIKKSNNFDEYEEWVQDRIAYATDRIMDAYADMMDRIQEVGDYLDDMYDRSMEYFDHVVDDLQDSLDREES